MQKTIWTVDPTHSEIQFKVRHLMITNVTGQFNRFSGTVETDGDDIFTAKAISQRRSIPYPPTTTNAMRT